MKMMTKLLLAAGGLYAAKRYGVTDMLKAKGVPVPDFLLQNGVGGGALLPIVNNEGVIVGGVLEVPPGTKPVTVVTKPPTQPNDSQDGTTPITPPHYTSIPVKTTVIAQKPGLLASVVRFVTAPATPTGGQTGGGVPTGPVIRRF